MICFRRDSMQTIPEYDEKIAEKGRREFYESQDNSAPRYNPFDVVEHDTSNLNSLIDENRKKKSLSRIVNEELGGE